jgi:hypothetical protein
MEGQKHLQGKRLPERRLFFGEKKTFAKKP